MKKTLLTALFGLLAMSTFAQVKPASQPIVKGIIWVGQSTPPSAPELYEQYKDSDDGVTYEWNGTAWVPIGSGGGSSLIKVTQSQAETATNDEAYMTALKTKQAIDANAPKQIIEILKADFKQLNPPDPEKYYLITDSIQNNTQGFLVLPKNGTFPAESPTLLYDGFTNAWPGVASLGTNTATDFTTTNTTLHLKSETLRHSFKINLGLGNTPKSKKITVGFRVKGDWLGSSRNLGSLVFRFVDEHNSLIQGTRYIAANDLNLFTGEYNVSIKKKYNAIRPDAEGWTNAVIVFDREWVTSYVGGEINYPNSIVAVPSEIHEMNSIAIETWHDHATKFYNNELEFKEFIVYSGDVEPSVIFSQMGVALVDNVAPIVTVTNKQNNRITINKDATYVDDGATSNTGTLVTEYRYENNSKRYPAIDTSLVGEWEVIYTVDGDKRNSIVARRITIEDPAQTFTTNGATNQFWVDSNGSNGTGTNASPFNSIANALAAHTTAGTDSEIVLKDGDYAPIDLTNYTDVRIVSEHKHKAIISGATAIPDNLFALMSSGDTYYNSTLDAAKSNIWIADISGISTDYGELKTRGAGRYASSIAPMDFVFNETVLRPARYPNATAVYPYLPAGIRVAGFTGSTSWAFGLPPNISEKRIENWENEPYLRGAGVLGYWWSDATFEADVYLFSRRIDIKNDPQIPNAFVDRSGGQFYISNAISELDEFGERWLDTATGKLYIYSEVAPTNVAMTTLKQPLFVATNASNINIDGLRFQDSRDNMLEVITSNNVEFVNSRFLRSGLRTALVDRGSNVVFNYSEVTDSYSQGIAFEASNNDAKKTITLSGHAVTNCHLRNISQLYNSYNYPITASTNDIGVTVSYNNIHDNPFSAIGISAMEMTASFNDLHNNGRLTGDMGMIYNGRRFDTPGQLVTNNLIHESYQLFDSGQPLVAIYFDDGLPNAVATKNIIIGDFQYGVFFNGGHNATVTDNVFEGVTYPVIPNKAGSFFLTSGSPPDILDYLIEMNYQNEPWASAYPNLVPIPTDTDANFLASTYRDPIGGVAERNGAFGAKSFFRTDTPGISFWTTTGPNEEALSESPFIDALNYDFTIKANSTIRTISGWQEPTYTFGIQ